MNTDKTNNIPALQILDAAAIEVIEKILKKGVGHRVEIETTRDGVRVFDLTRRTAYKTGDKI